MDEFVRQAEATLGARISDWRIAAKDNAHIILRIVDRCREAEAARVRAEAVVPAELDAARARQRQAEQSAAAAVAERDRLAADLEQATEAAAHLAGVGRDMADRISRGGAGQFLIRDSGRVVEKFQKTFGEG